MSKFYTRPPTVCDHEPGYTLESVADDIGRSLGIKWVDNSWQHDECGSIVHESRYGNFTLYCAADGRFSLFFANDEALPATDDLALVIEEIETRTRDLWEQSATYTADLPDHPGARGYVYADGSYITLLDRDGCGMAYTVPISNEERIFPMDDNADMSEAVDYLWEQHARDNHFWSTPDV